MQRQTVKRYRSELYLYFLRSSGFEASPILCEMHKVRGVIGSLGHRGTHPQLPPIHIALAPYASSCRCRTLLIKHCLLSTGRQAHVCLSDWAQLGPVSTSLATRRSPACRYPRSGSRVGPRWHQSGWRSCPLFLLSSAWCWCSEKQVQSASTQRATVILLGEDATEKWNNTNV